MKIPQQNLLFPLVLLSSALLLSACDQPAQSGHQTESAENMALAEAASETEKPAQTTADRPPEHQAELKRGNMFSIARDVASIQLKAGDFPDKLQQVQTDLQQAVTTQNQQQLQQSARELNQQLHALNSTLNSLNLKSQEIDTIRQHMLQASQQVLNSPFLNGDVDLSKIDFKKIEQQMGTIQMEMINLTAMLLPTDKMAAADQ
ncbi:hypothetical protein [Acinetobacter sp. WZC-1]|uniref:hypothetical protein n=1 Tax=Acinetobacter sp. WZC-1 TaxID=3459034 RepID=UPI00403DBD84